MYEMYDSDIELFLGYVISIALFSSYFNDIILKVNICFHK